MGEKIKESFIAGRIGVYHPSHPSANNRGYILRSRFIMEKHIGRALLSHEEVHHKDKNKFNDDIKNLEILTTAEHARIHNTKWDVEKVKKLRGLSLGYKIISKKTGIPRSTIRSICKRLKI